MHVFADGQCVSQQHYVQGVLHGPATSFDAVGRPAARLQFLAGRLNGPCEYFHEGQRVRLAHYKAGLLEGESTDFTADGQVLQSCTYRSNRLHGPLRRFGPGGELLQETHYRMGVPMTASGPLQVPGAPATAASTRPAALLERLRRWARGA
jgi:antitoxin component YwqK of YwqJK toxin-antitoxin module